MSIFLKNLEQIEAQNRKGEGYELGVNEFTDLTAEEFKSLYLGLNSAKNRTNTFHYESGVGLNNINWTASNNVQPVQNQGMCGSCWAFSAISAVESAYSIFARNNAKLSEAQLVECSSKEGNGGCQGGLMDYAFDYAEKHSLCTFEEYPYGLIKYGLVGVCKVAKVNKCTTYKVKNYTDVPEGNCTQLYNSLVQQPVAVAVDASNWQSYKSGIFPSSNCQAELNHGVSLTGFIASGSQPFWVVKNSWGAGWGNSGYIYLQYNNTCGICDAASFPQV